MFEVQWEKRALKQLIKIKNRQAIDKIRKAAREELPEFEKSVNVKALKKHRYSFRLRVGNYRVFFDVKDELNILAIEEVKKRDEHTY